tara:strand:- start:3501 stop:5375 length:1875 start_codon:yes stop_codon:yes gene_type:complete
MATNDKRLRVTELDFDDIKTNLKTFLKGQTEFKDYDFEGSGMSVLLDLLAYNTHYLAFNANMLANEMFLDSSALRSSIVSHAKMLGYTPQSPTAPKATIDVTLNNTSLSTASITAGTKFSTTVNGTTYNFVSKSDVSTTSVDGVLKFSNLEIFEGTYVTNKYIASPSDVDQKFTIPSNRVDTSTLTVKVQDSATDTDTNTYTLATDITQITDTSTVYFLKEVENGEFEVEFGDGVIGKGLSEGNVVILQYVVTNKDEANGASSFTAPSAISGVTDITVATVSNAAGGGEAESLASIKYNAPLDYATQGRAVTGSDYKVKVKDLFPAATTIQVWGGEDGNASSSTAEYGKVFISIKQSSGANLTTTQKTNIVDGLKKLKVASVTPVIVDPETTFIFVTTRFKYDSSETTKDVSDLVSDVTTTLQNFNTSELNKFDTVFRYSKVVALIDDTNKAIDSNITTIQLAQKFTPTLNSSTNYTLEFNNALYNPHSGHNSSSGGIVSSTGFNVASDGNEYFFDDDGEGNLRRYYFVGSIRTYADNTAGTVTYSTGTVAINALNITGVSNVDGETSTQIRLVVKPDSNDVVSVRNNLLEIDFSNSSITGEIDTVSSGSSSAGTGYTTTSSYS